MTVSVSEGMNSKYQRKISNHMQTTVTSLNTPNIQVDDFQSGNEVVAAVLTNQGKIALFERSQQVKGDRGLWHCITGFLPANAEPEFQARTEIIEEAGIDMNRLVLLGSSRLVVDDQHGTPWTIHAFHYESLTQDISINWENTKAQWTYLGDIDPPATVDWLSNVMGSLSIECYVRQFEPDVLGKWIAPYFEQVPVIDVYPCFS